MLPDFKLALEMANYANTAYFFHNVSGKNAKAFVDNRAERQVVSFTGTDSVLDFLQDITANLVERPWAGFVHEGFAHYFDEVREGVASLLNKTTPVFVNGHSLGGGSALLCALYLQSQGYNVAGVYTFGCPKVGGDSFLAKFAASQIPSLRFVNSIDLVPRLLSAPLYGHVNTPVYMKDGAILASEEEISAFAKLEFAGTIVKELVCHKMENYLADLMTLSEGMV